MSKEMICVWCGEKMMYSVLGQNLTSSHFCDNVDCKAFQMVLPDNLWKDIFAWNQSQRDLQIAKQALEYIASGKIIEHSIVGHESDNKIYIAHNALTQITHDNKE